MLCLKLLYYSIYYSLKIIQTNHHHFILINILHFINLILYIKKADLSRIKNIVNIFHVNIIIWINILKNYKLYIINLIHHINLLYFRLFWCYKKLLDIKMLYNYCNRIFIDHRNYKLHLCLFRCHHHLHQYIYFNHKKTVVVKLI